MRLETGAESDAPLPFLGFTRQTFDWFAALQRDNSKAFFERTHLLWEEHVRDPFIGYMNELNALFPGRIRLFRQHRESRFSPDNFLMKTTAHAVICDLPDSSAGYYAEISVRGLFTGTGYYQIADDQLRRYREAVDTPGPGEELADLVAALEAEGMELAGQTLATAPRGYPRDHPRRALLARKELLAGANVAPQRAVRRQESIDNAIRAWRRCECINRWLDRYVGPSELPPELRWVRPKKEDHQSNASG